MPYLCSVENCRFRSLQRDSFCTEVKLLHSCGVSFQMLRLSSESRRLVILLELSCRATAFCRWEGFLLFCQKIAFVKSATVQDTGTSGIKSVAFVILR